VFANLPDATSWCQEFCGPSIENYHKSLLNLMLKYCIYTQGTYLSLGKKPLMTQLYCKNDKLLAVMKIIKKTEGRNFVIVSRIYSIRWSPGSQLQTPSYVTLVPFIGLAWIWTHFLSYSIRFQVILRWGAPGASIYIFTSRESRTKRVWAALFQHSYHTHTHTHTHTHVTWGNSFSV
jgi:hypothetical protein